MTETGLMAIVVLVPYGVVVGLAYLLLVRLWRRFAARRSDSLAVALPACVYIVLERVNDRQGLNIIVADLVLAIAVGLCLPLKGLLPSRRWVSTLCIVIVGSTASVLAWLLIPSSRLFSGDEPLLW